MDFMSGTTRLLVLIEEGKERNGTRTISFQRCCSRYGSVAVRQKTGLKTPRAELHYFNLIQLRKLLAMDGRMCVSLVTVGRKTMCGLLRSNANSLFGGTEECQVDPSLDS